jgi:hypothetical protein
MFGKATKIILLVVMIAGLAYAGACVYANVFAFRAASPATIKLPDVKDAAYSVTIERTGQYYLTNKYEKFGNTYLLHGYFELSGTAFKFRNVDLPLDQAIYGTITVTVRPKVKTGG